MISRIIPTTTRTYYTLCQRSIGRPMLAATVTAPLTFLRNYSPQIQQQRPRPATPNRGSLSPHEVLNQMKPKNENEALASIIDGELDYDTDMGAASVNNIEAKLRAEATAKAEQIARKEADEFSKRHFD
ncbi:hypothetical protein GGI21_006484 [Coemansia aciculifera]|uniref:Uncharacterized protein n=1 Tax=Coemansia aciculifera TaxID=417176 RepID=A0ACC1M7T3_9FUNG|nr:hypothetical protein GGI21_006484 [Coemansia aciculifera]KAJ2899645.1 hypothetical protein IWW38_000889 [Coemansia aciculifera]